MKFPSRAGLGLALFLFTLPLTAAPGPGKVVFADGDVTANGKPVTEGALLPGVVTLKTGPASEVEVVFDGKNVFRLGASSVARVDFSVLKKTVTVDRGSFTAVLKGLAKTAAGDPAFTLRTPSVAGGVRGTSFHAEVTEDRTYFCTCNGSVALDDGTPADAVVLTNPHHGSRIYTRGADGRTTVVPGGVEGHDDALLQRVAQLVAYKIDWTKPD